MTTLLGGKLVQGAVGGAPAGTRLGQRIAGGRRGELVDLPGIGPAFVALLGTLDYEEVDAEVFQIQRGRGLELSIVTAQGYELVRARLSLARAVRNPDAREEAFGTIEEWRQVDVDTLMACWQIYGDVRQRLDPMSADISPTERREIEAAVKKKDPVLLRSYGVRSLSVWLATTDGLLSSSPSPRSPNSE